MTNLAQQISAPKSVLLVDEQEDWTKGICELLQSRGLECVVVSNMSKVPAALKGKKYDLIILDMMASKQGAAFLKTIKSHSSFKTMPVLICSDVEDRALIDYARKYGALDWITKSGDMDKLKSYLPKIGSGSDGAVDSSSAPREKPKPKTNKELMAELKYKLEKEELQLPSQPQLLYRLITLLSTDNSSMSQIGELVTREPGIATKVVKAANSTSFAGAKPAIDISEAMMRIGLKRTMSFVLVIQQANMFATETEPFKQVRESVWRHSMEVAVTAEYFGEQLGYSRPQNLFAFGLLHDIGKLALLRILMELPSADSLTESSIREIINTLHVQLGTSLFDKWGFPKEYVEVARYHHDPPVKNIHGKHLVFTSFANIVSHARESGLSENEIKRLVAGPHAEILKVRSSHFEGYNKALEEEMRTLRDLT